MDIKNTIKYIKYNRMSDEQKYVFNILINCKSYLHKDYPNCIFYMYNDKLLFELDIENNTFRCKYVDFWNNIENIFKLKYEQICQLIKSIITEFLSLRTDTKILIGIKHNYRGITTELINNNIMVDYEYSDYFPKIENNIKIWKDQ